MDYVKKYEEEANAKIKELQEIKKTIKPCPFCGKPVELLNLYYGNGNYGSGSHFVICCSNCKLDMEGPDTSWTHFYDHNDEVREFVKKWNTRCGGEHEVIDEFVERIKERALQSCRKIINCYEVTRIETVIDDIAAEMRQEVEKCGK